jgi:hypothetical protein
MLSVLLAKQLDQAAAMAGFLFSHPVEDCSGGGKLFSKALGVFGVDSLIVFFERDRQRQDFALGEAVKAAHGFSMLLRLEVEKRTRLRRSTAAETPKQGPRDASIGIERAG